MFPTCKLFSVESLGRVSVGPTINLAVELLVCFCGLLKIHDLCGTEDSLQTNVNYYHRLINSWINLILIQHIMGKLSTAKHEEKKLS